MSIATQLAPVWFFPAAGVGLAAGTILNEAWSAVPSDPLERVIPNHHTVYAGAALMGLGVFPYMATSAMPGVVRRFSVDAAERISAHMVERNWPGRSAVAGAVLAGLGVGMLFASKGDQP